MNELNNNGESHGYWEQHRTNGSLWYRGNYSNGKRHGYFVEYWFNGGNLWYKGNYVNGERKDYWELYNKNGDLDIKQFYL
jgi:antitoxin component YwqK of YwqJK toxin-antitoxin module